MAGKNDSTHRTAPAGGEETMTGQLPQSQQASSEAKRSPPRGDDEDSAPERPNMDMSGPCDDMKPPRGMLDRTLQAQLGRQLRSIYSDVASEPVPERFIKLLEELEAKEKRQ